jgi:3-hydroxyisobutyrate dehydrogenase
MKVGVAGLGRMGSAIARRLIEVGHEVVVWNRNRDKTKALDAAGAAVAATPSELADRVETVITILTDAAAIAGVYEGRAGLLEGNVSGKLFIEMSTVQPETEIALARKVGAKGAALVECSASPAAPRRTSRAPSHCWTRCAAVSISSVRSAPAPA